jgi:ArsR family transcriptional regulator
MEDFVRFFKALSDKTRLKIVWLLSKVDFSLCVCEIIDSLNENQYNVSRHLRALTNAGLLREKKEGRWVYYSLISPINQFHELILKAVATLPEELFAMESERLKKRLSLRKNGKCVAGMRSEECNKI